MSKHHTEPHPKKARLRILLPTGESYKRKVDQAGPHPIPVGPLPIPVRGLTISVKTYERLIIEAAVRNDRALAELAVFTNPMVGDWESAQRSVRRLAALAPEILIPGHGRPLAGKEVEFKFKEFANAFAGDPGRRAA